MTGTSISAAAKGTSPDGATEATEATDAAQAAPDMETMVVAAVSTGSFPLANAHTMVAWTNTVPVSITVSTARSACTVSFPTISSFH